MPDPAGDLVLEAEVAQSAEAAFDAFADDLRSGLALRGIRLLPQADTSILDRDEPIGRVVAWERGRRILLSWRAAAWRPDASPEVHIRFEALRDRTRIVVEYRRWRETLGDLAAELPGWFARNVATPVLEATRPEALGAWLLDRQARRPSGLASRSVYRDPTFHRPNFKLLLSTLALSPRDHLLEVGCGGGAFLHEALESGCRAAALDASGEMIRLAREVNEEAVRDGRLALVEADAEHIPYASGQFSSAVSTGVFGFIAHPVDALSEIHRVLAGNARFALFMGTRELIGTPAAPDWATPFVRFYEDRELREMATAAGFTDVAVERPDLEPFARKAGLPEHVVMYFRGPGGGQLLTARKA